MTDARSIPALRFLFTERGFWLRLFMTIVWTGLAGVAYNLRNNGAAAILGGLAIILWMLFVVEAVRGLAIVASVAWKNDVRPLLRRFSEVIGA